MLVKVGRTFEGAYAVPAEMFDACSELVARYADRIVAQIRGNNDLGRVRPDIQSFVYPWPTERYVSTMIYAWG